MRSSTCWNRDHLKANKNRKERYDYINYHKTSRFWKNKDNFLNTHCFCSQYYLSLPFNLENKWRLSGFKERRRKQRSRSQTFYLFTKQSHLYLAGVIIVWSHIVSSDNDKESLTWCQGICIKGKLFLSIYWRLSQKTMFDIK